MTLLTRTVLLAFAALAISACSSVPKYEKISAKYVSCDPKEIKPVEVTSHGWYRSWYVTCGGQEYFCRHSDKNQNDWNGCRPTTQAESD
ncbi:MAG: hypothetical protein KF799_06910 [Bdellovibrionales bacterium]|nr:hypothetical protein [Bdellovibrionales bacterium]